MVRDDLTPLRASVLWLAVRRTAVDGRSCREYDVTDEGGVTLLSARAFTWNREIVVSAANVDTAFAIIRSRAFPLTGRAQVRLAPSNALLGTVRRNGSFSDASGVVRGRFRDARSFRDHARESLFQGTMETLFSTGADSVSSGPDAFVLQIGAAIGGTLKYGGLPFTRSTEDAPAAPRLRDRLLPRVMRRAWQSLNAPRGWKFERAATSADDPRLPLAAAIFAAELSRW